MLASNTLLVSEFPPCVTTMLAFILWCTCFSVIGEGGCGTWMVIVFVILVWALVLRESDVFEVSEQEMQGLDIH